MIDSDERPLTGSCQCGAVRYRIDAEPIALFACHCSECRKQSGSVHGLSLIVPYGAFSITSGTPKMWSRPTDQGAEIRCWFCGTCGSRLYHQSSGWPEEISVKAGSIDQPVDFSKAVPIWTDSALPSVTFTEDIRRYPREPD